MFEGSKKLLCFLTLSTCVFTQHLQAKSQEGVEISFLAAFDAYLRDLYLICSQELESIKDDLDKLPPKIQNRAMLYHSYCQEKLKDNVYAASLLIQVDDSTLRRVDKNIYDTLATNLEVEIQKLTKAHVWFYGYFGQGSFSPVKTEKSASLYGFYGGYSRFSWGLGFGVEHYKLKSPPTNSAHSYAQDMVNFSGHKILSKKTTLRGYTSKITAKRSAGVSGAVYGLGSTFTFSPLTILKVDLSYSAYPSSALGYLSASQGSVSIDQRLHTGATTNVNLNAIYEIIMATAKHKTDPTTGFKLKSQYQRWGVGLLAAGKLVELGGNYWMGNEAFGVRNQGTQVYNALRNYISGYGIQASFHVKPYCTLKLQASDETYEVTTKKIKALTYIGGLLFNF